MEYFIFVEIIRLCEKQIRLYQIIMKRSTLPLAVITFGLAGLISQPALAGIFITEVAPWSSGNSPSSLSVDWFEVANTGDSAVSIAGWKMDDDSKLFANAVALSGITSIAAGESVIFLETGSLSTKAAAFKTLWFGANPPANLQIGNYTGSGVSLGAGGDAVNLYDASGVLQASVSFGASPSVAPYWTFDNTALLNNATISTASSVGVNGAFVAANDSNEIGSPGVSVVPEPAIFSMILLAMAAMLPSRLPRRKSD
jgi:hypothetical protein